MRQNHNVVIGRNGATLAKLAVLATIALTASKINFQYE